MMLDMDIVGRKVVRLSVNSTDEVTIYHLKPLKALREWKQESVEMVHVVDLNASHELVATWASHCS
ncbi:MAG: HisA/HisF-related TIM barrel protein [Candidatus Nezhaarchaeales archaeon]